tara:strand:- start:186 stop:803 length:618 start_codon:yes stop_codon:yes gene_type:complete
MSKISLKHSGGNVVSLNSPTSAPTSADVAFKLPNADGTSGQVLKTDGSGNLSFGADTGGKILQVVQTYSTTLYTTTNNSMAEYAALNTTITPSSSSNKILIMVSLCLGSSTTAGQGFQLYDGSTHISAATNNNVTVPAAVTVQIDDQFDNKQPAMNFLYSPSTTSATTIKVYVQADSGTTLYINRYGYSTARGGGSSMTLMEVAA